MSHPRSTGNSPIASPPATRRSHSSAGEPTPPGRRQLIPPTATGSCAAASSRLFSRRNCCVSATEARSASTTFSGATLISATLHKLAERIVRSKRELHECCAVHLLDQLFGLPLSRSRGRIAEARQPHQRVHDSRFTQAHKRYRCKEFAKVLVCGRALNTPTEFR